MSKRPQQSFARIDAAAIRISPHTHTVDAWPALSATAAEWRQWIDGVWALPSIAAAVSVASPTFGDRIAAALGAADDWPAAEQRHIAYSLARYLLRMRGRATPFGLFAGTAPLAFDSALSLRVGDDHQTRTRPDSMWIGTVIAELEASPAVRARLAVVRNDLCIVQGDRLIITWQPHASCSGMKAGGGNSQRRADWRGAKVTDNGLEPPLSLRLDPVVRSILDSAGTPVAVQDLVNAVGNAFPEKTTEYIDLLIKRLIDTGALITCLRPPGTTPDVLDHVLTMLDRCGASDLADAAPLVNRLRRIKNLMCDADRQAWVSVDLRHRLRTEMLKVSAVAAQPTVVDLRCDSSITLPASVADEAAAAAQLLLRLGVGRNEHWHAYRKAFVARYGPGAVVPVRELTDPTAGLGFPTHFLKKISASPVATRDVLLLRMAYQAAVDGQLELLLDDRLVQQIEAGEADERRAASNIDICVDVRAATAADLTAGRFLLGVKGIGRSVAATTGRFLEMFDEPDRDRMVAAYRTVPPCTAGGIVAQLSSPPSNPSLENVVHTLPTVDLLIILGEHRPVSPEYLGVDDLAVTVDGDRFYLLSMSRRCTVQPLMGNAAARHTMPLVARFLSEITGAADSPVALFSWGSAAAHLSMLPRVRYRRALLSPAQWTINASGSDADDLMHRIEVLRHTHGLPANVQIGSGDQMLHLDLDEAVDRAVLHHYAAKKPTVILTEGPHPRDYGWIGGRAHEVVVPLISTVAPGPAPRVLTACAPLPLPGAYSAVLPGGDVLFAKLYGRRELVDIILTEHVPALLADWPAPSLCWWVRFRDPADHLRLRLRTGDYGQAATRVGAWAQALRASGLITSLVLDTYQPETARYGSGEIMKAAEDLFAADSAAALVQLRAVRSHRWRQSEALTAASLVDLASAVLGGPTAGLRWLVDHPARSGPGVKRVRLDPDLVRQTAALAPPSPVPAEVDDVWRHRRRTAAAYAGLLAEPATHLLPDAVLGSLLHMHQVRAHGVDPDRESLIYRLARAVALSATHARSGRGQ